MSTEVFSCFLRFELYLPQRMLRSSFIWYGQFFTTPLNLLFESSTSKSLGLAFTCFYHKIMFLKCAIPGKSVI